MTRTLSLALCLCAALSASGIPLGLLQLGVWAKMFDQFYEETNSVLISAERVLDGNHRCQGCEFVSDQANQAGEQLSATALKVKKLPMLPGTSQPFDFFSPPARRSLPLPLVAPGDVFEEAESPPPRSFA